MRSRKGVFGTLEWTNANANFIDGCRHDCKYCYSKEMAVRFHRKTPGDWKNEEIRNGDLRRHFSARKGTIMFPSSHDIHPDHLEVALDFLEDILAAGNRVLIVSKPHLECIQAICARFEEFKASIMFRFTIGSSDSNTLKFWEPGAPDFSERLTCLEWAYHEGYGTSVSCEPMLDRDIDDLVEKVSPFVTDSVWIGKANFLLRRLMLNGANDTETVRRANQLIRWQSDENIWEIYYKLKANSRIRWKESIKRVVGIEIPTQEGLDI
jgi:DNA repair photolyase